MIRPFDQSGITRGADQIARYDGLAASLVEMLRATVETWGDHEAVVEIVSASETRRVTYRKMWDLAARVAGAIAVPVNTRFTEAEAEYVITDSGSKFVFQTGSALPDGAPFVDGHSRHSDAAAIFYTSGTTGFPKGAITTQEGFLSNVETCRRMVPLPFDGETRSLVSVPLFHVTGCNSQFLVCCAGGGCTVIMPKFDVQEFLRLIGDERISSLTSVPAVYWLALNQKNFAQVDTSGVRWLGYGGAPIAPDLVGRIMDAFPNARVGNGFGLSETSSVATYLPHEHSKLRPETVGFAAPVVDLQLDEFEKGSGEGELLIRGPNVVPGYWNKPEATRETFVDGWLRSGDIARIDADGYVQILDRKKDMVNRGGENVYCCEVENALAAHPAVFEVAVLGVPDAMMGEKVGAVIVTKPGMIAEVREILAFARERIADFKIPQYVEIREELLPRNPGGKILKKKLREDAKWVRA